LEEFAAAARRIQYHAPQVAQFSSMRLEWVTAEHLLDAEYWPFNLRNTVRFSQAMQAMYEQGYRIFLEIGPSPTLVGMGSQCVPPGQGVWLPSLRAERNEQILESLATLYVNGVNVDWKQFDKHRSRKKLTLPTYPFQRERFAIDAVAPASQTIRAAGVSLLSEELALRTVAKAGGSLRAEWVGSPGDSGEAGVVRLFDAQNKMVAELSCAPHDSSTSAQIGSSDGDELNRWAYNIEWESQVIPAGKPEASTARTGKNWLIFADRGGVGVTLSSLLKERGDRCVLVYADKPEMGSTESIFKADPACPVEFKKTLSDVSESLGSSCDGIIHLWSLDCPTNENLTTDSFRDAQVLSCGSVLHLVQSLRENATLQSARLWLVTQGTQAIGPQPTPVQVAQAPVRGLSRVIVAEHPELQCVNVDMDPSARDTNIASLMQELSITGDEDQVAFRQGARYVARLRRTTVERSSSDHSSLSLRLKPDATYLITGGLGDLGMKVAQWMAARGARNIVLMGRRGPTSEAKTQIDEMLRAGTEVAVFQGDVSVRADVKRLVSVIEASMPPLRGVIHAAGTWKGGILLQQDWESMLAVLAPKVQGAWNLHELTRSLPLDFFVSFSSGASILGAAGLGDYAAANSFLDALAHCRHADGLPGSSINWGPWADLGMVLDVTSTDTRRWSEHGMSFIPPKLALDALEAVIQQGTTQVAILPMDWVQLQSGLPSLANSRLLRELVIGGAKLEKRPATTLAAELLLTTDPLERQRIMAAKLQVEAARVLRLPVSKLEVNRRLNELGMDSLMALELKNRMQSEWGMAMPLATILGGPSITELAAILMAKLDDRPTVPDPISSSNQRAIESEEAQELLRQLPNLSDEDVDSILGRMMDSETGRDRQR